MRQAFLIALTLVGLNVSSGTLSAGTGASEILDQARTLVASREYQKAATILEEALPESSPSERSAMIDLLRQSYRNLISQAEATGKTREAAEYRDNLAILEQVPGKPQGDAPRPDPHVAPAASPAPPAPAPEDRPQQRSDLRRLPRSSVSPDRALFKEPSPLPDSGAMPFLEGPGPAGTTSATAEPAHGETPSSPAVPPPNTAKARGNPAAQTGTERLEPEATAHTPVEQPHARAELNGDPLAGPAQPAGAESELNRADRLFTGRKYEEAGRIYARLAAQNQLPAQRKQVWAYCRWVAVVARINAHPRSDREWDDIEQEIRSVQRLTPGNWYGEYLQSRVAEARRGGRRSARAGRLVVRGSAPDEDSPPRFPRLLGRSRSAPASPQGATPAGDGEQPLGLPALPASQDPQQGPAEQHRGATSGDDAQGNHPSGPVAVQQSGFDGGASTAKAAPAAPLSWQVRETANFRIYHTDPALAEKAAQAAEAVRAQQAKRWGSSAPRTPWSPRCDVYLYPTPRDFAQMTGQPETSPGFSTMGINSNRIIARRVNLRADHPQLLTAILPHEVTHVVLADLFTQQQIPRWADEGMAVLAEPLTEQISRASELTGPLKEGRVFKLSELMAIDYPNAEAWNLYYAQSVSLTHFLVELGTPEQFITFVRGAQGKGVENALREVYHIEGFAELENRWQNFARRQVGEMTASSREPAAETDPARRQ